MASRYLRVSDSHEQLHEGFEQIRRELDVPSGFGSAALTDAELAARRSSSAHPDATDLGFVTIDPASAMDLDQAVLIQRRANGYRVHYAIADVPGFVDADGALDREARARVQTLYSPDRKVPLHPTVLSEAAASLLPGVERPALIWQIDLDSHAAVTSVSVRRARIRSRSKLSYEQVQAALDAGTADESLMLLREVGLLLQQQERDRGGVSLPGAEQEIVTDGSGFTLVLRESLPVERWNAQISLLTGRAAAGMMLDAGIGILRTMPEPSGSDIGRVRAVARSLEVEWPSGAAYAEVIARMDPSKPREAALLNACPVLLRGAGYTPFDGEVPDITTHSAVAAPYAHVTAPLRRLVDRWGLQICLSVSEGGEIPDWVRASLFELPEQLAAGTARAKSLDRANVDLVEAFVLRDRIGDVFDAVVLDSRNTSSLVQLQDPPVIARSRGSLELGRRVQVRLTSVDLDQRSVTFVPDDQPAETV